MPRIPNAFATLVLLAWIPMVFAMFATMRPRRAVITGFLAAWMFLPMSGFEITGLPDYTKMAATCVGALLGAAVLDLNSLLSFRFRWFDIPILVWCFCPLPSSLVNQLGLYDGLSVSLDHIVTWFLPYYIGRVYFNSLPALRELAMGIFIGCLIYVPFCVWEMRMSPQLHRLIYGFNQHMFAQAVREGGYRPVVFMQHGLMVAMYLVSGSIIGVWFWARGVLKQVWGVPMYLAVPGLLIITLLCRSSGATILLLASLGALFSSRWLRTPVLVLCLVLAAPAFMFARATGFWSGRELIDISRLVIGDRPADSLEWRMDNEDILLERARERPILGWGGWGRARVFDADTGVESTYVDGLWIITLGDRGALSLAAIVLTMQLPVLLVVWRAAGRDFTHPVMAAPACLAILLVLYGIDMIPNAMINPIFMLGAGGISSCFGRRTVPELQALRRGNVPARLPDPLPHVAHAPRSSSPTG